MYKKILVAVDLTADTSPIVERAKALRIAGGSQEDEEALQREVFQAPGMTASVKDLGRAIWWRARRAARA